MRKKTPQTKLSYHTDTFLLTYIASILGECTAIADNNVSFSYKDKPDYCLFVDSIEVLIVEEQFDDSKILYAIIGYLNYHNFHYEII